MPLKTEFYKLSNEIYTAIIRKVFFSEFWCKWNRAKDLAIPLNNWKTPIGYLQSFKQIKIYIKYHSKI